MQTEIRIDPNLKEPKLILETPLLTDEQREMLETAAHRDSPNLLGYQGEQVTRLFYSDIVRFYTSGQRVLAETEEGVFSVRLRIYELEQLLKPHDFIRISQGEIIHLAKTEQFDLSLSGTIGVWLKNGQKTYVSRRYMKKLKAALGL